MTERPASTMLRGVRVVSLALQLPGPYCGMLLADLGADVIIVEPPGVGDPARWVGADGTGTSGFFQTFNRNKRSLALDLKQPEAQQLLHRLLATADVLLEGFRPGVAERLGIGRDVVKRDFPNLVYASISGYGQTGPDAGVTGHDISYVARAGLPSPSIPTPDGFFPLPLADLTGGALATIGVLAALVDRAQGGAGRYLDISLSEAVLSWAAPVLDQRLNGEHVFAVREPAYGTYTCGDGKQLTLSIAFEDHFWRALCDVIGVPDLRELDATERCARGPELRVRIEERLGTAPASSWLQTLADAGVPVGPIPSIDEVMSDPQFGARGMFSARAARDGASRKGVANPLLPPMERSLPNRPAPRLGEHTGEVLAELGYSEAEMQSLRDRGVVG